MHGIAGYVADSYYTVPLGQPKIVRKGDDVTIVSLSQMTIEAIKASEKLAAEGISTEVIDLRSVKPIDYQIIFDSIKKTGRLIVADTGWETSGFGAEIVARVSEKAFENLKTPPTRVALPDVPSPTTWALAKYFYKRSCHIVSCLKKFVV